MIDVGEELALSRGGSGVRQGVRFVFHGQDTDAVCLHAVCGRLDSHSHRGFSPVNALLIMSGTGSTVSDRTIHLLGTKTVETVDAADNPANLMGCKSPAVNCPESDG